MQDIASGERGAVGDKAHTNICSANLDVNRGTHVKRNSLSLSLDLPSTSQAQQFTMALRVATPLELYMTP